MSGPYTEDDERCFRLSALIVNVGTAAARRVFDNDVQRNHGSLSSALNTGGTHQRMQSYLNPPPHRHGQRRIPKLLNQHQFDTLYPTPPQVPTSNNFDLTLLMFLFRNLLHYPPPPVTGNWNDDPHITDLSPSADLVRLRMMRNAVFAHINSTQLTEADYKMHWTDMENILVRLDPSSTPDINSYKQENISQIQYEEYKIQIRQLMESDLSDLQCMLHVLQNLIKEKDASLGTQLSAIQESLGHITEADPTPVLDVLKKLPAETYQMIIQTLSRPLTELLRCVRDSVKDNATNIGVSVKAHATTEAKSVRTCVSENTDSVKAHVTKESESVNAHTTAQTESVKAHATTESDTVKDHATEKTKSVKAHATKESDSVRAHVTENTKYVKHHATHEGDSVRAHVTKEAAGIIEAVNALNVKRPDDDQGGGPWWFWWFWSLMWLIFGYDRKQQLQQNIIQEYLQDVSSVLKSYYEKRYNKIPFIPWDDTSKIRLDDIYVPLKLEENKDEQWKEVAGEKFKNIEELISKHGRRDGNTKTPVKLIIQGKPGSGKSTSCYKLVYDWTKSDSVIADRYELVIQLKARDFSPDQDLLKTITDTIPDYSEVNFKELRCILKQKKVLIIIDGYDELGEKINQTQLNKLLDGTLYHKCDVIVTTRHWCTNQLKKRGCFDQIFTVCAFDDEDTKSYVSKFFTHYVKNENKDVVESFISEVSEKNIDNLLEQPLTCLFLCIVWQELGGGEKLPKIQAQIYDKIMQVMKETYKKKVGDVFKDDTFNPLLNSLSKLAFEKLVEKHSILQFEIKDLEKQYKIDVKLACAIGLLVKADPPADGKTTLIFCDYYTFPHMTFQEFLGARYLYFSEVDLDKAFDKMERHDSYREYSNVYNFFFGHLSTESDKDITEGKLDRVNQMSYLREVAGRRMVNSLGETPIQTWEASGCYDKFKWAVLSNKLIEYFAKPRTSTVPELCLEKIRIADIRGGLYDPVCESVREYFNSPSPQCQADLCFSSVSQKLAQSNTLKELFLELITCDCESKGSSLGNLLAVNKDLKMVVIYGCDLNANDAMVMAPHLSHLNALIYLQLDGMSLAGSVVEIIENLCETIKHIIMARCGIRSEEAKIMAPTLKRLTLLTEFNISHNPLGSSAIDIIENLSPSIQTLPMVDCGLSIEDVKSLAPHLHKLTALETLWLWNNVLDKGEHYSCTELIKRYNSRVVVRL